MSVPDRDILRVVKHFLRALDFKAPSVEHDPQLLTATEARVDAFKLGESAGPWRQRLPLGVHTVEHFYPGHPFDLKMLLAMMIAGTFCLDDVTATAAEGLIAFATYFHQGQPQDGALVQPVYRQIAEEHLKCYEYYEPLVASQMIAALVAFAASAHLEQSCRNGVEDINPRAKAFPKFTRLAGSLAMFYLLAAFPSYKGVAFAEYAQALPDLAEAVALGNDVLSYYKERDGEETNYINSTAHVTGKSPLRVLKETAVKAGNGFQRALAILEAKDVARDALDSFIRGGIALHLSHPRYRLPAKQFQSFMQGSQGSEVVEKPSKKLGISHVRSLRDKLYWLQLG